ncbi:hypothetical protein [Alicyclobacillus sp. SO9]|uniref:hypothetical protein n=1 Tax=Alicyclobacillus sp. SO9 TaxID=2665646 RepID=UPI0018E7EF2F|nr:hypothetical protein [Alicyclobacillus sp. SO9]QQE81569.1 hypothetical protein GI364_24550 [Alicyclobacillus sp. SO9]
MENPIVRVCREKNISYKQLAILTGCDGSLISQAKNGTSKNLKGKLLAGLVSLGYDGGQLIKEYDQWRKAQADELKAQFITA